MNNNQELSYDPTFKFAIEALDFFLGDLWCCIEYSNYVWCIKIG